MWYQVLGHLPNRTFRSGGQGLRLANDYRQPSVNTNLEATPHGEVVQSTSYARKFVISEDEIDSVLSPLSFNLSDEPPVANINTTWTNILAASGLFETINNDANIPQRLALISPPPTNPVTESLPTRVDRPVEAPHFFETFSLKTYRLFPEQRDFNFGTVNLIYGVNGSGKTSLLESIELFFCGRNKRNPRDNAPYEITATLTG